MQCGLGVSTFPWGRATHACEKESPLTVYDPEVEGDRNTESGRNGRANETRTRTGRSFPSIDRGVSDSLMPRISVNRGMTIMPLIGKTDDSKATKETTLNPRRVKEHSATSPRVRPRALLDPTWVMEGLLRQF
ncbi:hypothetical protein CRG98_018293 [Punica granatum]|uniref:Uncharacterized protein n=1 Tax=Punica granatum TaxID=22663 RepID=A0A2I0JYH6_PUNGR|nr:hypothetical protein CRG98_018293 [Punica granatum]